MTIPAPNLKHDATKALWHDVLEQKELETHELAIFARACLALDRAIAADEILDAEGLTVPTKNGIKSHPMCVVQRDQMNLFSKLMRQLGFKDDPLPTRGPGRPPHSLLYSNGQRR
jgi:hypothetical protein